VVTNQGVAECEIEFAMVQPDARRRGAGRTLVREAAEWAERMGAKELWLEVRESNEAARRLYAACGFAVTGRRRGYYADPAEDALLMRLALGR
jgi:ribosomal-protein-alanine N-acetyltransferase